MRGSDNGQSVPNIALDGLKQNAALWQRLKLQPLSVLYVDIIGFSKWEQALGNVRSQRMLVELQSLLATHAGRVLKDIPFCILHVWDDGFAVLVPHRLAPREQHVFDLVAELESDLSTWSNQQGWPIVRLRYGYAFQDHAVTEERFVVALHDLIVTAGRVARRGDSAPPAHVVKAFRQVLATQTVTSLYQPIVHLETGHTLAWESLVRGPAGSPIHTPTALFECAEQLGCLFELERICRQSAIASSQLPPDKLLFLNVHPKTLQDPAFREGETRRFIDDCHIHPEQIVFEITEHQAISDYRIFNRLVEHYRSQGYRIAIDDTGAGHSGLVTLMNIQPDFVKVDMALIRDIDVNSTKQSILKAIRQVSDGFGATVIAEGIETVNERDAVEDCGVRFGQGFLFGRPEPSLSGLTTTDLAPEVLAPMR